MVRDGGEFRFTNKLNVQLNNKWLLVLRTDPSGRIDSQIAQCMWMCKSMQNTTMHNSRGGRDERGTEKYTEGIEMNFPCE